SRVYTALASFALFAASSAYVNTEPSENRVWLSTSPRSCAASTSLCESRSLIESLSRRSFIVCSSSREVDPAEVNTLAEVDVEPLRHTPVDLDHDAIAPAVRLEPVDLELAERVRRGFAHDGARALELDLRVGHAVGDRRDGLHDRAAHELVRETM